MAGPTGHVAVGLTLLLLIRLGQAAVAGPTLSRPSPRQPDANETLLGWNGFFNGGGRDSVMAATPGGIWPRRETEETAVRHNLCGAAAGDSFFLASGPTQITYVSGSTAQVQGTTVDAIPGHFEFRICKDASQLTQSCLNEHLLTLAPNARVTIDSTYPERFYVPATPGNYQVQLSLPANLSCDRCVLQWYFVQADRCLPPGYKSQPLPGFGLDLRLPTCGQDGAYPDEFWACADVAVLVDPIIPVDEIKLCTREHTTGCKKVFGYVTNWAGYRPAPFNFAMNQIDAGKFTHLLFAFATVGGDGRVTSSDARDVDHDIAANGLYEQFHDYVRQANPQITTLISIGGINFPHGLFSAIASNRDSRARFIASAIAWARAHAFDGIDVDWEFPAYVPTGGAPQDRDNFVKLMREMRDAIDQEAQSSRRNKLVLTAAVNVGTFIAGMAYDIPKLHEPVDYLLLMAYDLHGSWESVTGAHTALHARQGLSIDIGVQYWLDLGAPKEKLVLGTAAYGRGWTLSENNALLGAPASGPSLAGPYTREEGLLAYFEIEQLQASGYLFVFDNWTKTSFATRGNQWVGFDNPQTMAFKGQYVMDRDLAGVMMWSIDQDNYLKGSPLMSALRANMRVSEPPPSAFRPAESGQTNETIVIAASAVMIVLGLGFIACIVNKSGNFESVNLQELQASAALDADGNVPYREPPSDLERLRTELLDHEVRENHGEVRHELYLGGDADDGEHSRTHHASDSEEGSDSESESASAGESQS